MATYYLKLNSASPTRMRRRFSNPRDDPKNSIKGEVDANDRLTIQGNARLQPAHPGHILTCN